ncbi:hypothetical protein ACFVHB_34735 [Kitasatospora sp. NPDC127111]|uniref:hypothetical protein n=1 Tax=Kitasatospora sp. NPDC127111 TaxID=3345363 RepID=UPI0036326FBA
MTPSFSSRYHDFLVPVVAAAATVAAVMLQEWFGHRSRAERRKAVLEEAARRVSFASDWWDAMGRVNLPPDELARARDRSLTALEEAFKQMEAATQQASSRRPRESARSILLLYPLHGWGAKLLRVCYLTIFLWTVIVTATIIPAAFHAEFLATDLTFFAGVVVVLLTLRAWAISADRHHED